MKAEVVGSSDSGEAAALRVGEPSGRDSGSDRGRVNVTVFIHSAHV